MEIKKIGKKLDFEVEAQWKLYDDCDRDCWDYYEIWPKQDANDWHAHQNGWLADCDCYANRIHYWGPTGNKHW